MLFSMHLWSTLMLEAVKPAQVQLAKETWIGNLLHNVISELDGLYARRIKRWPN